MKKTAVPHAAAGLTEPQRIRSLRRKRSGGWI
jgi:hypothetical protein